MSKALLMPVSSLQSRASHAAWLPSTSAPPHDPRRLPLNALAGWHLAASENIEADACGALQLQQTSESKRYLTESNGSFGGLQLPKNVEISSAGGVFLLDREKALLKKLDPCACRFVTVPCTGGIGSAAREFNRPQAIKICGDSLLVADTDNKRVVVYSLLGFMVRAFWLAPLSAAPNPWQPTALALSQDRKALVADPANGCVHVFNFAGKWLKKIEAAGAVQALAVDDDNKVYISQGEGMAVQVYSLSTSKYLVPLDPDNVNLSQLSTKFSSRNGVGNITSDAEGRINVGEFCARYQGLCADEAEALWFDSSGNKIKLPLQTPGFHKQGLLYSEALDSHFYRCQWDRFILQLSLPKGSRLKFSSFGAESLLSDAQIQDLSESQWQTQQWLLAEQNDDEGREREWDCLIRSVPSRYLWFRIEILSDGLVTPRLCNIELNYPRISLRRYLPAVFGEENNAADFTDRFLAIFDRGFRQIEQQLDGFAHFLDPLSAPAEAGKSDFLSWLASWIGITLDRQLPLSLRRNLVKNAGKLFKCRGTLLGLRSMLDLVLGFSSRHCNSPLDSVAACGPCRNKAWPQWQAPKIILEHFALRRWLFVGSGRLGDQAQLWGKKIVNRTQLNGQQFEGNAQLGVTQLNTRQDPLRDPFHVYAHKFTVFLPAWVSRLNSYKKAIARLVEAEKPAHTEHHIVYVEPRFRVGIQSMIGFDSVIACYPQGVTLGEVKLGKASVLSETDKNTSSLRIGEKARIGTTTKLG